jgi:ketosteroid isomerase-like protein
MADLLELTRRMLRAIEEGDEATLSRAFAEDVVQVEHPNRLVPNGATRDHAALIEGFRRGKKVLTDQRYELHHALVSGDDVAYECTFTATLAVPLGNKQPGDTIRARFAVFLRFRADQIISQRNYDCFETF